MTINEGLRMMAGVVILISTALVYFHSQYWLLLTAFVGLNLLQSAFSKWCPAMNILKVFGFKQEKVVD